MDGVALVRSTRNAVARESKAAGDGRVALCATPQERAQRLDADRGDKKGRKETAENGAATRRGAATRASSKCRRRALVDEEDDQLDTRSPPRRAKKTAEGGDTSAKPLRDEQQPQRIVTPTIVNAHTQQNGGRQQGEPTTLSQVGSNGVHAAGFPAGSAVDGQLHPDSSFGVSQSGSAPLVQGLNMEFPQDEIPMELCVLSSDGSPEPPIQRRTVTNTSNTTAESPASTITTTAGAATLPEAQIKLASDVSEAKKPVIEAQIETPTAKTQGKIPTNEIQTQTTTTEAQAVTPVDESTSVQPESAKAQGAMTAPPVRNKRGRRRKNLFPDSTSKAPGKKKQGEKGKRALSGVNGGLNIATPNGEAKDASMDPNDSPPSPVYPDAEASHLYPSKAEGVPWQWEDCDPFFAPLRQDDLANLERWRKDNANMVAANPGLWRTTNSAENERAVLEAIVTDAPDIAANHVELPMRRGRNYRDVWKETDFLTQQRREKKRKSVVDAESPLLSHHDLVYGYNDDLFQDYQARLKARVETAADEEETISPDPTSPLPLRRLTLLQNANSTDLGVGSNRKQGVVFDEVVLPSLPCEELHPASLGSWKLRKKQQPDFSVVHPACLNRNQQRVRWKEEAERHRQQQYERQCHQADDLDKPSDGEDEGIGDTNALVTNGGRHHVTVVNSEVNGQLPSFGNSIEEDEISRTLAASVAKLVPLAMYNWRTSQLVLERAACSLQCAPVLEGEAAASRALEGMFLQLFPPRDDGDDVLTGTAANAAIPTRQPRAVEMQSAPHDLIAYSLRSNLAGNCSPAVAASVEFALMRSVGDEVDVLDRNGCWNHGEVVEIYVENEQTLPKFLLLRFSLWGDDTVEWIAVTEGRILPRGVADGSVSYSVGPTRAHCALNFDKHLASLLERSYPLRQAKQDAAAAKALTLQQSGVLASVSSVQQKTSQKRKRKRVGKTTGLRER